MRPAVLFAVLFAVSLPFSAASGVPRGMVEEDLYRVQWVGDPRISPDGTQVAFTRTVADTAGNGYFSSVWLVPVDGGPPRALTHGEHDRAPRWSPDGRTLAFLRPGRDENGPQIWLLSMDGGEAIQLTDLDGGAGEPFWSPGSDRIAFPTAADPEAKPRDADPALHPGGWKSDTRVITRPAFRANGRGYLDPDRRTHVWVVSLADPTPQRLTAGEFDETIVGWGPRGDRLYFLSDRRPKPWFGQADTDLFEVSLAGGTPARVLDMEGRVSAAALGPDGTWALAGSINPPVARSYVQSDLLAAGPMRPGVLMQPFEVRNLTDIHEFEVGPGVGGDMSSPTGGGWFNRPVWTRDGRKIVTLASERGASNLVRVDAVKGRVEALTTGNHAITAFTADAETRRFAFLLSSPVHLPEVWTCEADGGDARRLTGLNDPLLDSVTLSGADEVTYASSDGLTIQGWIMKPIPYEPGRRYPLLVEIHGGPHFAYGYNFMHEFQVLAARGYLVFFCNPRGSTTYGQEFGDAIQYRWPGADVHDILAGVDTLLASRPVDGRRMGVTGGSGGGYLTNWIIVKDHRFAAAAAQRTVSEWLSFYWTSDMTLFTPFWFAKQPWQDPMEYIMRSPAYFAEQVRTPLLLIHSEDDLRTPLNQAEAMFRALRGLDKEAVMVVFPGENHNLSRSGSPHRRVERLRYLAGWFDWKLKGIDRGLFGP